MGKTLPEIAQQLKDAKKKVQLIYAFNGTGKTRLSRDFIKLISSEDQGNDDDADQAVRVRQKALYYNALSEDLFYWENASNEAPHHTLQIQVNSFTGWLISFLKDQGQDGNIVKHFQRYTNSKITPNFDENLDSVTFSLERGGDDTVHNIKISRGEESNFVWSVMYTFLDEVANVLNEAPEDRSCSDFDELEYIFIDDPVSSLDESHLIEIAVDLVGLIKKFPDEVKFVVSTHNALFYNVIQNTFKRSEQSDKGMLKKYVLQKMEDGLVEIRGFDEAHFSYHLHVKEEIEKAILSGQLKKYHFNFLRNILEKTAIFLGHQRWQELLPDEFKDKVTSYEERLINISSHSDYAGDEVADLNDKAASDLKEILEAINAKYNFKRYQ